MATQKEKTEIQRLLNRTLASHITISDISAANASNAIGAIQETAKNKRSDYVIAAIGIGKYQQDR